MSDLYSENWQNCEFVAFDTETTGQYPLTAEICELAAVKWKNGEVIDTYQSLVKPGHQIPDKVIEIHGITNEMVSGAPTIEPVVEEFLKFSKETVLVAHHAAFDLGFLAVEIEKMNLALPSQPVICSSLLSRSVLPKAPNHRLQTLIPYLQIEQGTAHRALDDSMACLHVALHCFQKLGSDLSIKEIIAQQGKDLRWQRFSMDALLEQSKFQKLLSAIRSQQNVSIVYSGGSRKGQPREVETMGLVRSLDGDYLVATCLRENKKKRFYLNKIEDVLLN